MTFYKAVIPIAYWRELKRGVPQNESIRILRWPPENGKKSGLYLAVPNERFCILEGIIKIRDFLLQSVPEQQPAEKPSKWKGKMRAL